MSQVEAAASLFGSSDSGSDFFSVSECENSPSISAAGTSSADDFYSSSSHAASNLFGSEGGGEMGTSSPLFGLDEQEHGFVEEHPTKEPYGAYPLGEGYEQPVSEEMPYEHVPDTHDNVAADAYNDNLVEGLYTHANSGDAQTYEAWQAPSHDMQYQGGNEGRNLSYLTADGCILISEHRLLSY